MCGQTIQIKAKIDKAEYISFDIFDTLIVRPFYNPSDLFYLLDSEFEKHIDANISFHEIRIHGEDGARKSKKVGSPLDEDIDIKDIYDFIEKRYSIPHDICNAIMKKEKDLEIHFSTCRKYVYELYQYAIDNGKKVVICSDMYLDEDTIKNMLRKNGILKWDYLLVSSKTKKLKRTGNMYDIMLESLKCNADRILHIGDDENSDIERAAEKGIETVYIPKTKLVFENADSYAGSKMGLMAAGTLINYKEVQKSVGYGNMIAMVANKFFDNPFLIDQDDETIFKDSYNIGYYFLGMHIIGILNWMVTKIKDYGYKKVHFLSRDGWLIKQAYDIYRSYGIQLPSSEYLYVSRQSLLPTQIQNKLDLYDLPIEFKKYSPETLLEMLDFCTIDAEIEQKRGIIESHGIVWGKKFGRLEDYQKFIEMYICDLYDESKHSASREIIKKYLGKIGKNEIMFDMGYSGRIQCAINRILVEQVDVFMIHSDAVRNMHLVRKGKFKEHCFYDYYPSITGMLREYLLSEVTPSCIGYQQNENEITPFFETDEKTDEEKNILLRMYEGVIEFVENYCGYFADYVEYIPLKSQEVSLPFEGFLREATEKDYELFKNCFSDDKIYGKNPAINIARFWRNRQKELSGSFILKK